MYLSPKHRENNSGVVLAPVNPRYSSQDVGESDEDSHEESGENHQNIPQPDSDVVTEDEDVGTIVPVQTTWRRAVVPRWNSSQNDIYYYEEGRSTRLRSLNEVENY